MTSDRSVPSCQGAGTDEEVLVEILASRDCQQIKDIVAAYRQGEQNHHFTLSTHCQVHSIKLLVELLAIPVPIKL